MWRRLHRTPPQWMELSADKREGYLTRAVMIFAGGLRYQSTKTRTRPRTHHEVSADSESSLPQTKRPQVHLNGELTLTHESYSGSTFNTLGATGNDVTTVTLKSTGLMTDEWISLIEVSGDRKTVGLAPV